MNNNYNTSGFAIERLDSLYSMRRMNEKKEKKLIVKNYLEMSEDRFSCAYAQ